MPRDYLLFRLSGPLSAWGEIAVGERRSSWPRPSKSAVLGLVAAALGYERSNAAAHAALNDGLHFAVRVDTPLRAFGKPGEALKPLRDFHTAEFPPQVLVKEIDRGLPRAATRADHLRAIENSRERRINPVLSERWYWIELTATIALSHSGSGAPPALAGIEAALRQPAFALYLGRKSCPLGRPLNPRLIPADGLRHAFRVFDGEDAAMAAMALPGRNGVLCRMAYEALALQAGPEIWADIDAVPMAEADQTYVRRDAIRDRRAWTFSDRTETKISGGGDVSHAG